jgi:hypothetical protein
MIKRIILTVALTVTTSVAFSQDNSEYTKTLSQMMIKNGSQETFNVMLDQMTAMMKQQKPEVPELAWADLNDDLAVEAIKELTVLMSPVYQKHLSLEDLKGIIAFYNTPIGKKFAKKTPLITNESMQVTQQWGMQLMGKIQQKLKDKGY